MRLFQIIAGAQGGRAFVNMANVFGFGDEVMAQTTRYFIPAITKAIERRTETAEGLQAILEFFASRRFERFLDDPRMFSHPQVMQEGVRILNFLFERDARIQRIVDNRVKVLPIDRAQLLSMFPVIAVMVLGAVEIRTRRPLVTILNRLTNGMADERSIANPYLALAQHLKMQGRKETEQKRGRLFAFLSGGGPAAVPRPKLPETATIHRAPSRLAVGVSA